MLGVGVSGFFATTLLLIWIAIITADDGVNGVSGVVA